jgi:hypothetical protein
MAPKPCLTAPVYMRSNVILNILSVEPVLNITDRPAVTRSLINALNLTYRVDFSRLAYRSLVVPYCSSPIDIWGSFWLCVALLFNSPAIPSEKVASVAIEHHYLPFGKAVDLCLLLRLARRRPDFAPRLSFRFFRGERVGRRGSNLKIGGKASCGACHRGNLRRVDRLA